METMIGPVVNILLTVAAGLFSIRWLRDAVEVSRTRVTEMSPNNNEAAEQIFLELLDEAETEIVMYDAGDDDDGSLYQSQEVVQAIRDKLHENAEFKVDCVLNNRAGATLFETELAQEPNVKIRERRDNPSRVHYKIIDGRKAHVSCHEPGKMVRNSRMIDCSNAPSRRRDWRPLALRRYFDDFESCAA